MLVRKKATVKMPRSSKCNTPFLSWWPRNRRNVYSGRSSKRQSRGIIHCVGGFCRWGTTGADPDRDPTPRGGGSMDPKIVAQNNVLCRSRRPRIFSLSVN